MTARNKSAVPCTDRDNGRHEEVNSYSLATPETDAKLGDENAFGICKCTGLAGIEPAEPGEKHPAQQASKQSSVRRRFAEAPTTA